MRMKNLCLVIVGIFAIGCGNAQDLQSQIAHRWMLSSLDNAGKQINVAMSEHTAYVDFDANRGLNGNAGCNGFFGDYTLKNNKLHFVGVGMTRMLCAPESMAVEDTLVQLFADGTSDVLIQSNQLIITRGSIKAIFHR
ncbi:META domain-containing protein [Helicobacter sp. MIT 05-5293]|uniref:META domain-containing protein n=1 Tax=Helicobacter sp. MIT 05-5293 TaxID=1548149 RepID=UPI00051D91B2|nr:META domain-containing protein [Helicobacter sp. MIT 05-5293]TLD80944.1 META domain-containing protein [Helicobacter sp. MIT 05-5293]